MCRVESKSESRFLRLKSESDSHDTEIEYESYKASFIANNSYA